RKTTWVSRTDTSNHSRTEGVEATKIPRRRHSGQSPLWPHGLTSRTKALSFSRNSKADTTRSCSPRSLRINFEMVIGEKGGRGKKCRACPSRTYDHNYPYTQLQDLPTFPGWKTTASTVPGRLQVTLGNPD